MTQDYKERYERTVLRDIKALIVEIELNGWNKSTYTTLRLLQDDIERLNALDFFLRD